MVINKIAFIIIAITFVINALNKTENTRGWNMLQSLILLQILGLLLSKGE